MGPDRWTCNGSRRVHGQVTTSLPPMWRIGRPLESAMDAPAHGYLQVRGVRTIMAHEGCRGNGWLCGDHFGRPCGIATIVDSCSPDVNRKAGRLDTWTHVRDGDRGGSDAISGQGSPCGTTRAPDTVTVQAWGKLVPPSDGLPIPNPIVIVVFRLWATGRRPAFDLNPRRDHRNRQC